MKTVPKNLKRIIKDFVTETINVSKTTLSESRLPWGEYVVGDWIVIKNKSNNRESVVRFDGVEKKLFNGKEWYLAHVHSPFGYGSSQRADIMLDDSRLATPEEVKNAKEQGELETARLADLIDTSKEGT